MPRRGSVFQTLPPFNNGLPLRVIRFPRHLVEEEEESKKSEEEKASFAFGVVDETTRKVFVEQELRSVRVTPAFLSAARQKERTSSVEVVTIPSVPDSVGEWKTKTIGGVSATVRRTGVTRCLRTSKPVCLFAVRVPDPTLLLQGGVDRMKNQGKVTVGDAMRDDEFGNVVEIVVHSYGDVSEAAAAIARAGGTVMFEDASLDAHRTLGVERLDRIGARATTTDEMVVPPDGTHGLRRGADNWAFSWIPKEWKEVPITWDHMVKNFESERDLEAIPQPLLQHVASRRLASGVDLPVDSWTRSLDGPTEEEREWERVWGDATPERPLRKTIRFSKEDAELLRRGRPTSHPLTSNAFCVGISEEGEGEENERWYRPVDPRFAIRRHVPKCRYVSAALTPRQSKQLLDAFYFLCVEKQTTDDPDASHAAFLVMFHYARARGYVARWMGKYVQKALHVGNGVRFRKFRRMAQYAPHRLPVSVLNKLHSSDGKVRSRGSKGSRSKYGRSSRLFRNGERYVPENRVERTREDEESMRL